jgi:hypothetical protein
VRRALLLAAVGGCGFEHGQFVGDAATRVDAVAVVDAMVDAAPPPYCAAGDPHLRLCFSFDQVLFTPTLANEGAANVSATLTNVTRLSVDAGSGGAAQLDATSEIFVPYTTEVSAIRTIEIVYRFDSEPTSDGGRMGLVDSNVVPPNISLFFYRKDPTHQLRCGLGSATFTWDATLAVGTWIHLACVCDAGHMKMFVDGAMVGDTAGDCDAGGAFVSPDGFVIGANNNGGPNGVSEPLLGAIDGLRLWDTPMIP